MSKKSILEYFPYPTIRDGQKAVLQTMEQYWDRFDVFVVVAPTASGKSAISKTISAWRYNTATITPTNLLVQQYVAEFPNTNKLYKRERYKCPRFADGKMSCEEASKKFNRKKLGCSLSCEYLTDNRRARGRGSFVANYYTYMANKLYKPILIADEAHGLIKVVRDMVGQKIWRHDYKFPWNMWYHLDMMRWLESIEDKDDILTILENELKSSAPRYIVKRGTEFWNRTNPPEERELLTMLPVDVADAPPFLWPQQVKKLVLLSATISYKDIESLGLDRRRVLYLEVDSPIPPSQRPIITDYVGDVNRNNIETLTREMADRILNYYLPRHEGEKGLIHATYAQAKLFRQLLGNNDRFLFHDKTNTKEVYDQFINSDPKEGKVFVASGLYEGIDLAGDLGRWQIVAKIPWPNLGDPAIKYKAGQDPSWYVWQALQLVKQACGRISRGPTDYGLTIVMDKSFDRLVKAGYNHNLVAKWWEDALPQELRKGG